MKGLAALLLLLSPVILPKSHLVQPKAGVACGLFDYVIHPQQNRFPDRILGSENEAWPSPSPG